MPFHYPKEKQNKTKRKEKENQIKKNK